MTRGGCLSVLAIHGNVYNLRELCPGRTDGGNVVAGLLGLYETQRTAFVSRLRGEFALALWDGADETLYLATDPFRVHPLFYAQRQGTLIFGSRMKGILACPALPRPTIDPKAIVDVIASSAIPTPRTIFQEVKKLPPGHLLTFRKGEVTLTPYWDVSFLHPSDAAEAELARRLKTRFADAVSLRLAEDGVSERIGAFLSGGVDSSTLTGVLTQIAKRPIHTFSIGFAEQPFNEIEYARLAARTFGSCHHEYFVTPQNVREVIPILLEAFDEPFANASAIPTYCCAKLASDEGMEVLYAGDGGDELFAGNERYATQRLFDDYYRIPGWIREPLLKPLVSALADGTRSSVFAKGKKYITRASIPYPDRLFSYGFFTVVPMEEFLHDDLLTALGGRYDPYAMIRFHYAQAPAREELDRQLYLDLKLIISDGDLFKVTRMTEAAGVTVRYPFLDAPFVEFASTVPAALKMRGRRLRVFFKNAYADLLPRAIRTKTKHGFGLPIPVWLRTDGHLHEMMRDLVLSPRSLQRGYFRRKAVEELVERHRTDTSSFYGTILWHLMVLELWHRAYAD